MSVKLFFWNVRGLNDPDKHIPFVRWLSSQRPLFGALLETHIKEPFLNPILTKLCPGWKHLSNHNSDPDGRIIMIWKDPLDVIILSQSRQCVTCMISIPNQALIYYSAIYASNESDERVELWNELLQTHSALDLDSKNWVVGGDLNQILFPVEHSNPTVDHMDNLMCQLQDCFLQAGLFDLRYLGPLMLWHHSFPLTYQIIPPVSLSWPSTYQKLEPIPINSQTTSQNTRVSLSCFKMPGFMLEVYATR